MRRKIIKVTFPKKIMQAGLRKISRQVVSRIHALNENFSGSMERLQDTEIVSYARMFVNGTREQILEALNIPTNDKIESLTKKISQIEKKLSSIQRA